MKKSENTSGIIRNSRPWRHVSFSRRFQTLAAWGPTLSNILSRLVHSDANRNKIYPHIKLLGLATTTTRTGKSHCGIMAPATQSAWSRKWVVALSATVICGFISMLLNHSFDPMHIISDIDDEEAVVIIDAVHAELTSPNHASHLTKQPSLLTSSTPSTHPSRTPTDPTAPDMHGIILSNPLDRPQCQNALLEREGISRPAFIRQHYNTSLRRKCKAQRIWDADGIWSREYLDAISTHNCFTPRLVLRTSLGSLDADTRAPVFYHIPVNLQIKISKAFMFA